VVAEEIDEKEENLVECSNMCLVHILQLELANFVLSSQVI
jgi:hypothetical protein